MTSAVAWQQALKVAWTFAVHIGPDISQHENLTYLATEVTSFSAKILVATNTIKSASGRKYFAYKMRGLGQQGGATQRLTWDVGMEESCASGEPSSSQPF
jgi:dihydroorotate dehydrogenase